MNYSIYETLFIIMITPTLFTNVFTVISSSVTAIMNALSVSKTMVTILLITHIHTIIMNALTVIMITITTITSALSIIMILITNSHPTYL